MKSSFAQAVRGIANRASEESKHNFAEAKIPASEKVEATKKAPNQDGSKPETVVVSVTKLTPTMEIYGEIKSKDAIQSAGQIFGNVATTQAFMSKSLTVGNVSALNVSIKQGRIKGDITAVETADISNGSIMVGDINCGDLYISGKVKGNCDVRHDATIFNGALLAGDLVADNITTEQGARINGNVTMRNDATIIDIEAEFDLGGDF